MAGLNCIDKGLRIWRVEGGLALLSRLHKKLLSASNSVGILASILHRLQSGSDDKSAERQYVSRLGREIANFKTVTNVHDLPAIFHYWAHNFLQPKCEVMGIQDLTEFFVGYARVACRADPTRTCYVASLGAGNCETEVAIAEHLLANHMTNFVLDCIDLNPHMLARGRDLAAARGVAQHLRFVDSDIKGWSIDREYAVVMANQSLHHFQELELLFRKTQRALGDEGLFVVSDVIGRNGHMRWPEALEVVHRIWKTMPERYKYNHLLRRHERMYDNWDCSVGGFEGIRAQDILPLLVKHFHFELFLAYGNIIDIFIDRAFGHNFDVACEEDRRFIDMVGRLDDDLIDRGVVKPTHLFAVMRNRASCETRVYRHWTQEFCLRHVP
ncbi:MAG TPA: class I SAM-dependent methyltransferase [Nitrospiraceae bacterium]|nr:class I SAM-dependent methyltransferase [Nitrospiraceae bacterium]